MEGYVILSERSEDRLKAVEWARWQTVQSAILRFKFKMLFHAGSVDYENRNKKKLEGNII